MKIVPTTTTTTTSTVPWSGLHRRQKRRRRNLKSSNKDRCGGLWSRSYRALFVSEPSSFFTQYPFKPSFKYHVQKSIAKSTHTPSSRRMKDIDAGGGIYLSRSGIKISFCRLACFKRTGLISIFPSPWTAMRKVRIHRRLRFCECFEEGLIRWEFFFLLIFGGRFEIFSVTTTTTSATSTMLINSPQKNTCI